MRMDCCERPIAAVPHARSTGAFLMGNVATLVQPRREEVIGGRRLSVSDVQKYTWRPLTRLSIGIAEGVKLAIR